MSEQKNKVDGLFRVLENTAGVQSVFVLTSDSNMYFSDEKNVRNDSAELKIFMDSTRFLDALNSESDLHFKLGHWQFEKTILSLYLVNDNKLLIIHSRELFWEEFDEIILDILLTL
ncbi:MAG TPA: hypothetical protein EYP36_07935 [Calditrichaeota bacterium]|nr:hypothetical protein [Calditrichota bacterium]